jgi:uncharacterized membrane protein
MPKMPRISNRVLWLTISKPTDSQMNFLMEVLRATDESKENCEIVYPLLQANSTLLDG